MLQLQKAVEAPVAYYTEDVLRELVMERIRAVNTYIRQDVEGFQEEWLQCAVRSGNATSGEDRKRVEQAKKRLADLDVLLLSRTL